MSNTKKSTLINSNEQYVVHMRGTLNNMIFSLNTLDGNTVFNTSCGASNFTGSRKASAFATQDTGKKFIKRIKQEKINQLYLVISGVRRMSTKKIIKLFCTKFEILTIYYPNVKPHNGCKVKKQIRR